MEVSSATAAAHHNELLARGRCGHCAERVSSAALLRGANCPTCDSTLSGSGRHILDDLKAHQLKWRLAGYGLIGAGSFMAGTIPLLQIFIQILALFILHIIVLRGGLEWLPVGRRVLARISMKFLGAAIASTALLINVAVTPLLGLSAFILGLSGPLLTAIYVEGGLVILRRRLRWESERRPLQFSEWALPVGLLVLLLVAVAATIIIAVIMMQLISAAEILVVITP